MVLFVGELEHHEGVDKLISISEDNPDIDFWFCGSGSMESRLREAESKQENIKYLGYISDEKSYLGYIEHRHLHCPQRR